MASSVFSGDTANASQKSVDLQNVLNESERHFQEFIDIWHRSETLDVSKKYQIEKTAELLEEYYLQLNKPEYISTICTQMCKKCDDANLTLGAKHYIMKHLKTKYKNASLSKDHEHLRRLIPVPPQDVKLYGQYVKEMREELDNIDYSLMTRDMVAEHTEWAYDHERKNTLVCDQAAIALMDRKPHNPLDENSKQKPKQPKISAEKPEPTEEGIEYSKLVGNDLRDLIECLEVLHKKVTEYPPINRADAYRWSKAIRQMIWFIKPWIDDKYRRDVFSWVKIIKNQIAAGGTHASRESGSPIPLIKNPLTGVEELRKISKEHIDNRAPAIVNGMVDFINYFPFFFELCMHYQASKMAWMDKRAHDVRGRMVDSA